MKISRKLLVGVAAFVLAAACATAAVVATRASSNDDQSSSRSSISMTARRGAAAEGTNQGSGESDATAETDSAMGTNKVPGSSIDGTSDRGSSDGETAIAGSGSATEADSDAVAVGPDASESSSGVVVEDGSPSDPSVPSPVGDRGVRGPVTPPRIDEGVSLSDLGPILSSPSASCGSKIIFSVRAQDMNGVSSVWGAYYIGGSKFGFTSSSSGGDVWSTTILNGSAEPVTSLVVYAKDGLGNNSNLAVGTLCA